MIVRRLEDLPAEAVVEAPTWTSRRLLLARDGMGFSLHVTVLKAGTRTPMQYKNHLEAVYCVSGWGELQDLGTSRTHPIEPGTVYALDRHDQHVLTATTDLHVVCVFNPPLLGPETHDEDGSYPLLSPRGPRPPEPPDPYASRVGSIWHTVPRSDPVVHGQQHGPLSPSQLQQYERDGFLVLEDWLPVEQVAALLTEAERLSREAPEGLKVQEPDSAVVRSVFAVHRDGIFASLAHSERLAGAAAQILGGEVYLHQSRVNFKPGLQGREFPWHSDFETWHVEDGMPRMRALTAAVHLQPSTAINGPLLLVPGSHQLYLRCVGQTPAEHHKSSLRRQEYGVPTPDALAYMAERGGIVPALGGPGTVVLFDCNTLHGSAGNPTPWPRAQLFLVYNSVHNALGEPTSGLPPRPTHLAEREIRPIRRS
jgi:ectoine hydroxylase